MVGVDTSQYGLEPVMRDTPDWNRDEQSLFRGDSRTPAEIRADGGFRPPYETRPDWQNNPERNAADIAQHVGGNTNAFVSTSTDRGVARDFAIAGHVYVINAPGGIYTDPSMRPATGRESHGEAEVLFPGGVNWDYVRGWHPMTYEPGRGFVMGDFVPNPDYGGSPTSPPAQYGPASHDATRTAEPSRQDTSPLTQPHGGEPSLGDRMGQLDDPRLDALRPHVQSTDGGMSAFAPPDSADARQRWDHQNEQYTANQVPRIPGQFVVDTHGSADAVRVGATPLSPRDLADIIRANPDYDGGPVSLLGCGTGSTPDGFAARLAQELGVPVTAPNSNAWVDHNGNVFAATPAYSHDPSQPARPTWPPNGQWNTYSPTGEQTVHSGPFPPGHTPTWAGDGPVGDAASRGDDDAAEPTAEEPQEPRAWDDGDPADVMQQMVDQELTAYWANFAYDRREFQEWCQSPTEADLPEIRPETRINCWEMVMYSAVVSGQLSHAEANRIYDFVNTPEGRTPWFEQLPDRLAPGGRDAYDPSAPPPQRGELVFWDGSNHVAMATGRIVNGSPEVYTFWPPPDTPYTRGPVPEAPEREGWGTQDRVKTSTIKELTDFMNRQREESGGSPVVVETGKPVWAGEP
jgi:hypothetical protein